MSESVYHPPEDVISPGQVFARRYHVIEKIGSGAMASVYLCEDAILRGKKIALKLLSPALSEDETTLARFQNEMNFTKLVNHPNVVRVYDFGQTVDNRFYITMEYVPGRSVGDHLADDPLKFLFGEVLELIHDTASGLQLAHQNGIIHRDLKPDNILLSKDGKAKVTDFGLARSMEDDFQLTRSGEAVGTPCYMAPEQFRGEKVDARTDIYALGIVAYELAAGHIPFLGENYHAIATAHLLNPLPEIPVSERRVPSWFQEFLQLCTQKDPKDRYQSMDEVIAELNHRLNAKDSLFSVKEAAGKVIRNSLQLFSRKR